MRFCGPKTAKIPTKSGFRGPNSDDRLVFMAEKHFLGVREWAGSVFGQYVIFAFWGRKMRFCGPKMAKIPTKSGFRGPKSDNRRVFIAQKRFLGVREWSGSVFGQYVIFAFWGKKMRFCGPKMAKIPTKSGFRDPKSDDRRNFFAQKRFLWVREWAGSVFGQHVIFAFWGRKMSILTPKRPKYPQNRDFGAQNG